MKAKLERNKQIVLLRDRDGLTFTAIGPMFGITKQEARVIYYRWKDRLGKQEKGGKK